MIRKILFHLGQRLRNPSIDRWLEFLKQSESWTLQELEAFQLRELRDIVRFAYDHSQFYREAFDAAGVSPEDIQSLDDIRRLPIVTKHDLVNSNAEIHTDHHFGKTFLASTSGSSGESLVFRRDESADSFNRASIFRQYSWHDVKPWDRNGYFWGFDFKGFTKLKTRVLDELQNRFRIFTYDTREFDRFIKKLHSATFVHGYSSMLYQSAKIINDRNLPRPKKLKLVKGTSEKIYDSYRDEIERAFGVPISSEYGSAEAGVIAYCCKEGNMHICMEGVFIEEVDNEILVTNLVMKSFPIIRYRLGDYIRLAPSAAPCPCGRNHRILDEVTGRIGSIVHGKTEIYPSLYFYYIFKNLRKKFNIAVTYQVIQREKGKLEFHIKESMSALEKEQLSAEIVNHFGEDMTCSVQDAGLLATSGKLKSFISYID